MSSTNDRFSSLTTSAKKWHALKPLSRANRTQPTAAEGILWAAIRRRALGQPFRRQQAVGSYIVDFICLPKRLIIEVDGTWHDERGEYDSVRDEQLKNLGYTILRFSNEAVLKSLMEVIGEIRQALATTAPAPSGKGHSRNDEQT